MADDKAAFGVFPQMKAKRSKQDREAAKNVPIDLARGALSGVLGAPGDIESLIRMLPGLSEETILPTSEDIEKRLPFRSETPVSQAATGLGQLGGGFYTGRGSPLRAIAAVPSAVKRAAKDFAEASAAGAPHVIKPKGGNWLTGSVERGLASLRDSVSGPYNPTDRDKALTNWIESNLTNYIKKEMATPEDPVRRLAEQGIVHIPSEQVGINRYKAPEKRSLYGGEQLGQSEAAKAWEDASDVAINAPFAEQMAYPSVLEKNPWLSKLDPQQRVYALNTPASGNQEISGLGFDHIIDVLREDLATGRIRPEQLNKVSMEQAVRRTYEYDQEMAKKMREAQIKATEGMPVHKEYPEGYKWIELAPPKITAESLPVGYEMRQMPNKSGGTYYSLRDMNDRGLEIGSGTTPELAIKNAGKRINDPRLEDALKYEGETMGHCVGGYCPDVMEGRSRIFSLRDAKGEPHVTIEVEPQSRIGFREGEGPKTAEERFDLQTEWLKGVESGKIGNDVTFAEWWRSQHGIPEPERPLQISQIKGKQNRAPKEEYLPYVQDFVRGGQWSDVGDIQNTGLYKVDKDFLGGISAYMPESEDIKHLRMPQREEALIKAIEAKDLPESGYVTRKEWEEAIRKHGRPTIGEADDDLLRQLQPPEGMKRGGVVISDNPDTMMLELQDKKYQFGGLVRRGADAAKKGIPFFSKVDEVAKELPRTKGTGAEFMKELEKTKGVKPAEIQHRKLDEIKAMPKMTKEQFLDELEKRPPAQLEEKVLGGREDWRIRLDLLENRGRINLSPAERQEYDALMDRRRKEGLPQDESPAKFQDYTLPGGENYREILLKLPSETAKPEDLKRLDFINQRIQELTPVVDSQPIGYTPERKEFSGLWDEKLKIQRLINEGSGYKSSHWDEPNVIAHARVSDRIGPNGEKVLHVEEIQSDWHQAGRKKGYANKNAEQEYVDYLNDLQKRVAEDIKQTLIKDGIADEKAATLGQKMAQRIADDPRKLADYLGESEKQMSLHQARLKAREGVPDAPFKKNWHELMMNRILADAAEKGYDRVALTPGVVQAKRYDLSKQVDELLYKKNQDGTYSLSAQANGRGNMIGEAIPENKLEDYVGKDVAQKIVENQGKEVNLGGAGSISQPKDMWGSLSGIDLQVGGEGMKGFYDKMLPDYLNSLGKKYGVEVDTLPIEAGEKMVPDRAGLGLIRSGQPNQYDLHSLKITPEMRQEFTEKGFPMYSIAAPVGLGATQIEAPQAPQPVQITDNPDAMMMELGDRGFAGGGIVRKGLKAVVNATKEAPMIVVPSNISNVKEAVRQSKGDYGARRVERAADEIPNLEKLYKEEALRQAFSGENNKAVVTMNPADFEKYAHSLAGRTRSDIGPKMAKLAEQGEIDKYTVPTEEYIQHLMRLQGGFDDIPYLNLYKNEVGIPSMPEIRGHEGRHRSRALAKQGENTSLVRISPRGDLYEGLPRRSQEEYIEALREELERSGRLVLPEIEDSSRRPAVKFPEPYAEGGKVDKADNGLIRVKNKRKAKA